jgi:hypothetical protein
MTRSVLALAVLLSFGCAKKTPPLAMAQSPAPRGDTRPEVVSTFLKQHDTDAVGCFERELDRDPGLDGHLWAKMVIDTDGAFAVARFEDSTIENDESLQACLAEVIKRWHVPPYSGKSVIVNHEFSWRNHVTAPAPLPPNPDGTRKVRGVVEMSMVGWVLRAHMAELASCRAPRSHAMVQIWIKNDGTIGEAKVMAPLPTRAAGEKCLVERLAKLRFPHVAGDGIAVIHLPFDFRPE